MQADLAVLHDLSARSLSREAIHEAGYLSLAASSDLHHVGYTVRHWLRLADWHEMLEYTARLSQLPRITIDNYADQVKLHKALGLCVVKAGKQWSDNPLFAGMEV